MRNAGYVLIVLLFLDAFRSTAQVPLKGRDESISGSQSFAIVVGVSRYKYIRPLAFADKDAELFRDWLRSPAGGKLKDDNIFCLLNEQADNANFWGKGFQWLKKKDLQRGDKLFIYLAGHGDAIDEDQYFFLGYDCKPDGDKNNYLVSGAIQLFNLKKKIAKETAKGVDVVFIMDACRTNELPGGTSGQNFLNTAISQKQTGEIMMLATAAGEESVEDVSIGNGHGLFTWYLVDGLTGMADAGPLKDNRVSFSEISNYVDTNVNSLARQRFKRNQDPYFCCNENNEKIVSQVDNDYLQQWQRLKKLQEKKSGRNSIGEYTGKPEKPVEADTLLIETYNRFNRAIRNNRLTGNESAEDYFQQLTKKYPGNPYTLDAKSTLAVEYLNTAQTRVNRYLDCISDMSVIDKQLNYEMALNLEKAIERFREDDEDFANSLYGRLYLLKASGDFGPMGRNGDISNGFRFAYAGLAFDPKGAYIHNKLAQLHFQNNNRDSALFYANKAAGMAPNWPCALTTLALIQNAATTFQKQDSPKQSTQVPSPGFGFIAGTGINFSMPERVNNPNNPVTGVNSKGGKIVDLGLLYFLPISNKLSFRPSTYIHFPTTTIEIQRRAPAGGTIITEDIEIQQSAINLALPFLFRLSTKKVAPYLTLGPVFSYVLRQDATSREKIPLKNFQAAGELGCGLEISLIKSAWIISPELSTYYNFTELKENANTLYAEGLSSLKQTGYRLCIYLRKK